MLNLYKKIGETPLECLTRFRDANPSYEKTKLSYAGRLDPMAEGVLLIIEGEENKKRDMYLSFDKEYETEIVFGVSTDTFDVLGLVEKCSGSNIERRELEGYLLSMPRSFEQEYPPYSSKTIGGVPLFELARKGASFVLPKKHVSLSRIDVCEMRTISSHELMSNIENRVSLVSGDFRQEAILLRWRDVLKTPLSFVVLKLSLSGSSGFYVRTFAHNFGKKVGDGAIALSIRRTKVGIHTIAESVIF